MKKLKSLKALSSLSAIAAITPIVATACNDEDTNDNKININAFSWSSNGNYLNKMSDVEIVNTFKENNKAGENDLPDNIYDFITIVPNKVNNDWVSITISANLNNNEYKGKRTINIDAKTELSDIHWKTDGEIKYYKTMGPIAIKEAFILNNPAGVDNIPNNIYDNVDVKITYDGADYIINIVPKSTSSRYIGSSVITISPVKKPVNTINWTNQDNLATYTAVMDADEIARTFIINNPAGQNNIPDDIYKYVDVIATGTDVKVNWEITIKANNTANNAYEGETIVIPVVCGYMKYDNKSYVLDDNVSLNAFCKGDDAGTWKIPLKGGNLLEITNSNRSKLTELCIPAVAGVQFIDDGCLANCTKLTNLYLGDNDHSGYNKVIDIGDRFLYNCSSLKQIDLGVFQSVLWIHDYFLHGCSGLTSIDLSPFKNLVKIGTFSGKQTGQLGEWGFLSNCTGLTSIDLSPLTNVEKIDRHFLYSCTNLTGEIDLTSLKKLNEIGNAFLSTCSKIQKVNLDGLSELTLLGEYFMDSCSSCKEVKLSNLYKLTTLRIDFLKDCTGVETLNLRNAVSLNKIVYQFSSRNFVDVDLSIDEELLEQYTPQLKTIEGGFLSNCSKLTKVDFSNQTSIETIGDGFLFNSTNVGKKGTEGQQDGYVKLDNLSSLKSIGSNFISCDGGKQMSVTSLDLSGMTKLEQVGDNFLRYNKSLTTLNFGTKDKGWTSFKTVGHAFLSTCTALPSIDLSSFINVETIGNFFMDTMSAITEVNLSVMTKLTSIGEQFLEMDGNLTTLYVPNQNPPSIGSKGFLNGCDKLTTIYVPKSEGQTLLNTYKTTSPWKDSGRDQKMQEVQ